MKRLTFFTFLLALVLFCIVAVKISLNYTEVVPALVTTPDFAQTPNNWLSYDDPKGLFTARLPLIPQTATEHVQGRLYNMYVSELPNETIYMISLITYPTADKSPSREKLNTLLKDTTRSNKNNLLLSTENGMWRGSPSVTFSIENGDKVMDTMGFVDKDILFVLSRISRDANQKPSDFSYFLDQFKVTP